MVVYITPRDIDVTPHWTDDHAAACPASVATTGADTPLDGCTCRPPSDEPAPDEPPDWYRAADDAADLATADYWEGDARARREDAGMLRRRDDAPSDWLACPRCGHHDTDGPACPHCRAEGVSSVMQPAADDNARQIEARFALETARAMIRDVADRLPSDESSAMALDLALAHITRAMAALPGGDQPMG